MVSQHALQVSREVEGSGLGDLQTHTQGGLQVHVQGVCIPASTEADPLWAVCILLERILVTFCDHFIYRNIMKSGEMKHK